MITKIRSTALPRFGMSPYSVFLRCCIVVGLFLVASRRSHAFSSHGDTKGTRRSRSYVSVRPAQSTSLLFQHQASNQQDSSSFFLATCIPGLSDVLAQELIDLKCQKVEKVSPSAVRFAASSLRTVLSSLLWLRTAHKVMELLVETTEGGSIAAVFSRDDLYQFVRESIDVRDLLGDGRGGLLTLSVQVLLNNPQKIPKDINHSHFSALTVKNAICDEVRDLRGDRPDVDTQNPDVPMVVVLLGQENRNTRLGGKEGTSAQVSIYRQIHQGSLHRRGYRQGGAIHKAAMKESLAAGLLLHSGWQTRSKSKSVLIDPMCGSGSLLLEGAMIAADLAPGLMRIKCGLPHQSSPCILRWKHPDQERSPEEEWKELLLDATQRAKTGLKRLSTDVQIIGNDLNANALELCQSSIDLSGLGSIQLDNEDCGDWIPEVTITDDSRSSTDSTAPWFLVTNPPWGVRLTDDMDESWENLRHFLRETLPVGSVAWILSGNAGATKHLGLRRSSSLALKTGQQDLRWIQYVMLDRDAIESREEIVEALRKTTQTRRSSSNRRSKKQHTTSQENEWLID